MDLPNHKKWIGLNNMRRIQTSTRNRQIGMCGLDLMRTANTTYEII